MPAADSGSTVRNLKMRVPSLNTAEIPQHVKKEASFWDMLEAVVKTIVAGLGRRRRFMRRWKHTGDMNPRPRSEFDRLVASGAITPPAEDGDPLEGCLEIRLPRGTATALVDSNRGEA
jgi:hypothetical protein